MWAVPAVNNASGSGAMRTEDCDTETAMIALACTPSHAMLSAEFPSDYATRRASPARASLMSRE
jgi:hypothetical protein